MQMLPRIESSHAMNSMTSELNLQASKTGTFKGYTTNINGEGYAKMTFDAKVLSQSDFTSWVAEAQANTSPMNHDIYMKLAQPKSEHDHRTYGIVQTGLFQSVVSENGHGQHRSTTTESYAPGHMNSHDMDHGEYH